jgi:thiol-disulfide isomerase/thioredoxin
VACPAAQRRAWFEDLLQEWHPKGTSMRSPHARWPVGIPAQVLSCVLLLSAALAALRATAEEPKAPEEPKKTQEPKKLAPEKVSLTKVDRAEFDKVIARHKGKVVLVDFWATWCAPCVKQFPHTVGLAHKYADKGLVVISVSFDDPDEEAEVRKFLGERGANFENLQSKVDAQQAIDDFQIDNGAIPNYWIYDRAGKLANRFSPSDPTKKFRSEDIDAAIEALLAKKAK